MAMGVLFPDVSEILEQSQTRTRFQNISFIGGRNIEPVA
jgi:hypothetical protein